jgi:hypothetical protein
VKVWECPCEKEVLEAVQSAQWEQSVHSHVSVCPICQEVVQVAEWMRVLAETPENEPALPSPVHIWWKAQRLEKRAAEEQATRPIAIFQRVASVVAVLSLISLSAWKWPEIHRWLNVFKQTWPRDWPLVSLTPLSLSLVSLALGLFCTALIVTVYTLLAENGFGKD